MSYVYKITFCNHLFRVNKVFVLKARLLRTYEICFFSDGYKTGPTYDN